VEKNREQGIGVWHFDDGESHWVAATSVDKAVEYFKEYCELTPDEYAEYVEGPTECEDLDAETIFDFDHIIGRDEQGGIAYATMTMRETVASYEGEFPAAVASSVY
jgi:hypothetical protein